MGNIDWIPIAEIPDELKDGREVLVWETVVRIGVEVVTWDPAGPSWHPAHRRLEEGVWCDRSGFTIHGITHFAEFNAPK